MRTIKVSYSEDGKTTFIEDWNFKKWTLVRINKETFQQQCMEMNGTFIFKSISNFVTSLYGCEKIYPEWNREEVFVNYTVEIIRNHQ